MMIQCTLDSAAILATRQGTGAARGHRCPAADLRCHRLSSSRGRYLSVDYWLSRRSRKVL